MDAEELKARTNAFAHRCVKLTEYLPQSYLGNHIRGQLIRCSTSVAANYRAACLAESRPAFVLKLSIVIEEIDETCFWMEFLVDEKLLKEQAVANLVKEAKELTCIFAASRKTARNNK